MATRGLLFSEDDPDVGMLMSNLRSNTSKSFMHTSKKRKSIPTCVLISFGMFCRCFGDVWKIVGRCLEDCWGDLQRFGGGVEEIVWRCLEDA